MHSKRFIPDIAMFAVIAATLVTGVVRANDPPAAEQQIAIYNYKFSPEVLTVPVGTTVTWTNKDDVPHSVVSSDKHFPQSGGLDTGDHYSYTFSDAGSYEYFCSLHPFMKGKIVVTDKKPATSDSY